MFITKKAIMDLLEVKSYWKSLLINKRKPHTCRLYTYIDEYRICFHQFAPADETEAFWHPHPWPATFYILSGGYDLFLSSSINREENQTDDEVKVVMNADSYYTMRSPLSWHKIVPRSTTYTMMINGPEFPVNIQHTATRRTKGKDLETLSDRDVDIFLFTFKNLLHTSPFKEFELP